MRHPAGGPAVCFVRQNNHLGNNPPACQSRRERYATNPQGSGDPVICMNRRAVLLTGMVSRTRTVSISPSSASTSGTFRFGVQAPERSLEPGYPHAGADGDQACRIIEKLDDAVGDKAAQHRHRVGGMVHHEPARTRRKREYSGRIFSDGLEPVFSADLDCESCQTRGSPLQYPDLRNYSSFLAPLTGLGLEGTPFSGTSAPAVHAMAFRIRVRQLSLSQVWW